MWNSSYCKANYDCNYCHTLVIPVSVSLQVTVHLHNAGATLLTGVGFLDSSYWRSWFGRAGRELPWEPQGCLWSQTQTHTHTHTHREHFKHSCSLGGSDSPSVHHINTLFVFTALCQRSLFVFPHSSSPAQHPRDTLHEMGFHTLVIITSWKNVVTIWMYSPSRLSRQRGERRTHVFHDLLFKT